MRVFILATVVFAASAGATAQVNKCTDALGKVTYSEVPCAASNKSSRIMGREATEGDAERDYYARQAHRESLNRTMDQQRQAADEIQPSQAAIFDGQPSLQNSASTRQQPNTSSNPETCDSYSTRKGCMGGARNANSTWSPKRGYYGGGGEADAKYEAEVAQSRAKMQQAAPQTIPDRRTIIRCDGDFCYDNRGGNYMKTGNGTLQGKGGMTCTPNGGGGYNCR